VQFTGIVKSFDADEGAGTIVRDRDKVEIPVRAAGLALGVSALFDGDRVQFDVDFRSIRRPATSCSREPRRSAALLRRGPKLVVV